MRVACRWLEARYFAAALADGEDLEDVAMFLAGADEQLTRKRSARKLQLVRAAGGEVA